MPHPGKFSVLNRWLKEEKGTNKSPSPERKVLQQQISVGSSVPVAPIPINPNM